MSISRRIAKGRGQGSSQGGSKADRPARPQDPAGSDFEPWLKAHFAPSGPFTCLIVLVEIADIRVTPLVSTFVNIIGDEIGWGEISALLAGSGKAWDGAGFFPVLDADGPLENGDARSRLRELEARIREDRLVLNEGGFFDLWGRHLKVEEVTRQ